MDAMDGLLQALKNIQSALVTAAIIADPNSPQELREELLVKIINPTKHSVQRLIDAIEKDAGRK